MKKTRKISKRNEKLPAVPDCVTEPVRYLDVTKVHPALRGYTGYCLHKVTTMFKAAVSGAFDQFDMQPHHFSILSIIASSNEVNQMKISEELGVDKASMVKVTDHLEKLGYIERVGSKEDRRVKNLHITTKGQKILQIAKVQRNDVEKLFLACLSENEANTFKSILLKILDTHQKK